MFVSLDSDVLQANDWQGPLNRRVRTGEAGRPVVQALDDVVDHGVRRRCAGGDADAVAAWRAMPRRVLGRLHVVRLDTVLARDVGEVPAFRAFASADHDHEVDLLREFFRRRLLARRGVAERVDDASSLMRSMCVMRSVWTKWAKWPSVSVVWESTPTREASSPAAARRVRIRAHREDLAVAQPRMPRTSLCSGSP